MMVRMASANEVSELRASFMAIDTDGSGQISASELFECLKKGKIEITEEEVTGLIKEIGCADGNINYSEFISAALDEKAFITDAKLRALFKQIASSVVITEADFFIAFKKLG
jgi:Ca2+-binding EF-hand superfamily protein